MTSVAWSLRRLVCAWLVAFTWAIVGDASAATKKAKELTQAVAAKPTNHQLEQEQTPSIPRANKSPISSTALESQPGAIQKQAKSAKHEFKATSTKRHRHSKVHQRKPPEAVVQPRTDLMYHGMLESPQRYDPRRNHLDGGVPNPHIPELIHDHFQELDRNQDGTIDPVERTFGRLDMDRDLHNRRPR
ncbi:MAG TPA: hypothetical protein VLL94_16235 [Nitrospiraceae bacterium]|nr:hypothetical protein [Nitrospiraceae bacterium]